MNNLEKKYWKRAKFAAYLLQAVPFLFFAGVNGSLARSQITPKSDIDFLIAAKSGRLWTCRFATTALVWLIGLKRTNKNIAGKICLNRYLTKTNLKIIPETKYHAEDISRTVALYDENTYDSFFYANGWMNKYIKFSKITPQLIKKNYFFLSIKHFAQWLLCGKLGDLLENFLRKIQMNKIVNNPLTNRPQGIIIANNKMLSFQPGSNYYYRLFE